MSDDLKDLLTLAAKACGIELVWTHVPGIPFVYVEDAKEIFLKRWQPDLDDGDGARMEGKLKIDLSWGKTFVFAGHRVSATNHHSERYTDHNNDRQAARRWASLRAAAQIGRSMP